MNLEFGGLLLWSPATTTAGSRHRLSILKTRSSKALTASATTYLLFAGFGGSRGVSMAVSSASLALHFAP
jgi:hypothetical protein